MKAIDTTKGFRIYYNLTKGGFTVQHYIKGLGWRKKDTYDNLFVKLANFKVYEAGRQQVIREHKKYVHAFVVCNEFVELELPTEVFHNQVTYNPFKTANFIDRASNEVLENIPNMYLHSVINDKGRKVGAMFY